MHQRPLRLLHLLLWAWAALSLSSSSRASAANEPAAATAAADGTPLVPARETCARLVTETLLSFDRALRARSFAAFHAETLSKPFAEQYGPGQLLETFQPFIAAGANLAGVEHVEPRFDPPPAVEDNLLKLKGFVPTRPMRVVFDFDYALEKGQWRLNAMTVTLRASQPPMTGAASGDAPGAAAGGAPPEVELAKLVGDTLADLNAAVRSGDFATVLAKASTPMKLQVKALKLKEAFAQFVENGTDLGAVAGAEPQFDGPPRVDGKQMTVSGYYRVLPQFVVFNIDYFREANQWKLLGISVNTVQPAELKRGGGGGAAAPADAPPDDTAGGAKTKTPDAGDASDAGGAAMKRE